MVEPITGPSDPIVSEPTAYVTPGNDVTENPTPGAVAPDGAAPAVTEPAPTLTATVSPSTDDASDTPEADPNAAQHVPVADSRPALVDDSAAPESVREPDEAPRTATVVPDSRPPLTAVPEPESTVTRIEDHVKTEADRMKDFLEGSSDPFVDVVKDALPLIQQMLDDPEFRKMADSIDPGAHFVRLEAKVDALLEKATRLEGIADEFVSDIQSGGGPIAGVLKVLSAITGS